MRKMCNEYNGMVGRTLVAANVISYQKWKFHYFLLLLQEYFNPLV